MTKTAELTDLLVESQKQTLEAIEQAQEWSLRATQIAVGMIPDAPAGPFAEKLPSPTEVVEVTYGFAGDVLKSQKAYALRLAEIFAAPAQNGAKS